MRCRSLVIGLVAGALVTLATASAGAASCSSLGGLHLRDTTIAPAEIVPAHVFNAGGAEINIPSVCKVTGALRPTSDSNIKFEVWMPMKQWNHRFQGVGNGGFAGSISERGLQAALRQGFAAAATDTGHSGTSVDASWAPGHPEKVVDFGYRAVHLTTLTAKAIVKAFYGTPARYAYFASCSDGGREALMEAQRFPTDYNGIIAGAPANNWTRLQAGAVWGIQATLANPASYIPASKLPAISRAVLAACGAEDGLPENYVNDPPACHFDPEQLLCKGADSTSCLTAPQVAALKKLYSGPRTPAGKQIYPGYEPGGELGPNGWEDWITGSAPRKSLGFILGTQFFANMVYDNAAWNFRSFNFGTDMESVDHKLGPILNATNPNLGPFKAHGGKLIIYHGWSDAAIPPLSTVVDI